MHHPARALMAAVFRFSPRRVRRALAFALVASLAESAGLALLVPVLRALSSGAEGGVLPEALSIHAVIGLYILVIALAAWLVWRRALLLSALRHDFIADLGKRAHAAAIRQPPVRAGVRRGADLTFLMSQDVNRTGQGVQFLFAAASALVQLPALAVLAIALSPVMALSAAALIAGVVVAVRPFDHRARRIGLSLGERGAYLFARADETVAHLPLIKTHGAERRWIDRYDTATDVLHHDLHRLQAGQATAKALTTGGGAVCVTLVVWLALTVLAVPVEEIAVLVLVMMRMLPLVNGLHQGWRSLVAAAPAHARVNALIETPEEKLEPLPPVAPRARDAAPAALSLQGVSITRSADGPATLPSLDLTLAPGTLTAVTGASGAGKSTLGLALAGLLPVTGGVVRLDGRVLDEPRAITLRRQAALVAQDPALFHDTLAANLRIADPDAPDAALWAALRAADAEGFAAALPEGLGTLMGDRGARLSGGERQRVAIARALLARPRVLILDEATSALDAATEARVFAALLHRLRETTILFITHRAAFLERADQVVTLTHGHAAVRGDG